ncbi:MAG: hypothetical protein KGS45_00065 [Planctomycetes bacterium]|nr:hypothetical protein [Planctomycetota bacterium]
MIRLNSGGNVNTAQLTTNSGNWTLTHDVNHTIRGDGRIYTPINNLGSIIGDTPSRNLEILNSSSGNSGMISAENVGIFRLGSVTLTQTGAGQIRAITASSIFLDSSTVIDGSLTAANNSFITIRNTTLSNVQIAGQVLVPDNHSLYIPVAGIINNADVAVNDGSGANGTFVRLTGGSASVTGTGTITLNASANLDTSQITTNSGNWTYTSGPGQIIRGTGRIYTPLTNNGIIRADRAGAPLEWRNSGGTNNNLVTTGGGPLNIVSAAVTQGANGRIVAANGVLGINSSTINGGSIEGTGSPVEIYNSNISASTLSGTVNVPNGFTFNLPITGITNNAAIRISDNTGAAGTYMRLVGGTATIGGTGSIILDANSNLDTAQLTSNSGNWLMNITSGQTIRGDGRVYARLTNDGTIIADQDGAALEWLNTGGNTNNSIARTANGGILRISSLGLTQSPTGRLIASDGPVIISGSTVVGGSIEGTNSQAQIANSTLDAVTTTGDVRIPNGFTLSTSSNGITNNGTIRVSDGVGAAGTAIRMTNGSHTFSGTGSIILNANSNLDTAQLTSNSGNWTMTFGPNQALRGTGRVFARTIIDGTLSPGEPEFTAGRISFINVSPVLTSSANAVFDIFGPTNFDQVEGNASWTIQGGTITIRFPGGFVGALGQSYTLIAGNSVNGTHTVRQLPAHPTQGLKYGLDYRSNAVILRVTCNIDFNSDGVLDLFDYLDFVQIFQTGELDADYNGDGITDFFDYLDFVAEFANGCN